MGSGADPGRALRADDILSIFTRLRRVVIAAPPWAWLTCSRDLRLRRGCRVSARFRRQRRRQSPRDLGLGIVKIRKLLAGSALAAMLMSANMALASAPAIIILPDAQYSSLRVYGGGGSASQTTTGSFSGAQLQSYPEASGIGTAYTSTTMLPNPTITATASLNVTSGIQDYLGGPSSFASYYYAAEVIGPTNDTVPVDLSYTLSGALSGPFPGTEVQAGAQLGMFADIPPALYDVPSIFSDDYSLGTFSESGSVSYLSTANTPFFIGGGVGAQIGGYTASSSITLDPILTIDPSFAAVDPNYLKGYSIVLSPGVGNAVSAAPESAAWAMMLLGIGGVGAAMRRRRRKLLGAVAAA